MRFYECLCRGLMADEELKSYSCFHFNRQLLILSETVEDLRCEACGGSHTHTIIYNYEWFVYLLSQYVHMYYNFAALTNTVNMKGGNLR